MPRHTTENDFLQSDGDPNGTLTPSFIGQICVDTTNGDNYVAQGLTDADWSTSGSGSDFSGNPSDLNQEGATDGQAIVWNDSNSQWEPQDVESGGSSSTGYSETLSSEISNAPTLTSNYSEIIDDGTRCAGIYFNSDGTKAITLERDNPPGYLKEYTLSTPYDVRTATKVNEINPPGSSDKPDTFYVKSDGTQLWVVFRYNIIQQCDLSNGWDLSTLTHDSANSWSINEFSSNGSTNMITEIQMYENGRYLFCVDKNTSYVISFELGTPYDLDTKRKHSEYLISEASENWSLEFDETGYIMYLGSIDIDVIYLYTLSRSYDLSSASYRTNIDLSSHRIVSYKLVHSENKLYTTPQGGKVEEYSISRDYEVTVDHNLGTSLITMNLHVPRGSNYIDYAHSISTYVLNDNQAKLLNLSGFFVPSGSIISVK